MLWSMTHSMLTGHPREFESQTGNRPPDRVNSNSTENMRERAPLPRLPHVWAFRSGRLNSYALEEWPSASDASSAVLNAARATSINSACCGPKICT